MASGSDCGFRLRHALGCAEDVWRMCVINHLPAVLAARTLGLHAEQVQGSVRLLKSLPSRPSDERLALVVLKDPGLDDDDVAEIFDRSTRWVAAVRNHADELRTLEPIQPSLEWLESGLQEDDPSPDEILARSMAIRLSHEWSSKRLPKDVDARSYLLSEVTCAFVPFSVK